MSRPEKDIIRNSPCAKCGREPPFADGSRCHVHRLVPSRGYVTTNVEARCGDCHAAEPGHPQLTKHSSKGGFARAARLTAEERSAIARKAGLARARLHPDELRATGLRGLRVAMSNPAVVERGRQLGLKYGKEAGRKGGLNSWKNRRDV